ncbi:MAG: geranyl transferase [Azospira oryzae]|uniref:Polyprenyl synthetase family protein n=1 Tax=Pelomicrobium methylotrophicum TaxID=2602750 RepID=A0A5C7EI93_9PROT|nr:farnesyl diphosphate synthase [Pelomicrobium methylotrophicum]PZP64620.1 MAG: geranyl transferase [Azospira oryzae]PZP82595.1 MAG: geranyl transferase [Azospira oryzae]TXF12028.1 polyprenyl synthetase family protein [Pelomicrobium methylotrophicum]
MPGKNTDFQHWARSRQGLVEEALNRLLPPADVAPQRLHQAMRYAALGGGKRVRPLLCYAAGEVTEAELERLTTTAVALELIHVYSLVHDDLPCMDDDVLRRGKPTCHVEYDEPTALLVGDSLQSLAFQLLAEYRVADSPQTQLKMLEHLARAAGSRGMAGGQAIDLEATGKTLTLPELEFMHIHKTGALIRASVMLGANCGRELPSKDMERLDHFAKRIGLAFQVIDDVLDAQAPTATLGKTAGKDARQGKATYVSAMGVEAARAMALDLKREAVESLASFGERARRLRELADFIVAREF